jgi:hypothetical protein
MSEYRGPEALLWLTNNKNPHGFAGNRFETTADAIEAVKRLYAAGATRVYIGPPLDEPERIRRDGGPYADVLDVVFPKEKTSQVMAVVSSLSPDEGGRLEDVFEVEDRYRRVMLWWD